MNLSDGKSDGFMLAFIIDGVAYPIVLEEHEKEILGVLIPMGFEDSVKVIKNKPMGKVDQILKYGGC